MKQRWKSMNGHNKIALAVGVAIAVFIAGIVYWRATADERARKDIAEMLYSQCLANAITSNLTDAQSDAAIAKCDSDYKLMIK